MWNLKSETNKQVYQNRNRLTDAREQSSGCPKGKGWVEVDIDKRN